MIDIAGTALTGLDRERLCHPLVGGVILFSRNYVSREQLFELTGEIHALREPPLLIAVDHEGGRVQRFRQGFTRLSAMRVLGQLHDRDRWAALAAARDVGLVLAAELRGCGVDLSFTPVLDLDYGPSRVIGDRAFHRDPAVVIALAEALGEGLRQGGMGVCGKHFPGHGYVVPDSHVELPVDDRQLTAMQDDLEPYRRLSLDAVMAAHVIYPCLDCHTAVFSNQWINYLRHDIGFTGAVFTDDLSMAGAGVVGDMLARVRAAWAAGCDMLLVCNAPEAVAEVLEQWRPEPRAGFDAGSDAKRAGRIARLLPQSPGTALASPAYRAALESVLRLEN
jgi:beta-N-acetylhexosaminidase